MEETYADILADRFNELAANRILHPDSVLNDPNPSRQPLLPPSSPRLGDGGELDRIGGLAMRDSVVFVLSGFVILLAVIFWLCHAS